MINQIWGRKLEGLSSLSARYWS